MDSPKLCTDSANDWIISLQLRTTFEDPPSYCYACKHSLAPRAHLRLSKASALPIQFPGTEWGLDHARCFTPYNKFCGWPCEFVSTHGELFAHVSRHSRPPKEPHRRVRFRSINIMTHATLRNFAHELATFSDWERSRLT